MGLTLPKASRAMTENDTSSCRTAVRSVCPSASKDVGCHGMGWGWWWGRTRKWRRHEDRHWDMSAGSMAVAARMKAARATAEWSGWRRLGDDGSRHQPTSTVSTNPYSTPFTIRHLAHLILHTQISNTLLTTPYLSSADEEEEGSVAHRDSI